MRCSLLAILISCALLQLSLTAVLPLESERGEKTTEISAKVPDVKESDGTNQLLDVADSGEGHDKEEGAVLLSDLAEAGGAHANEARREERFIGIGLGGYGGHGYYRPWGYYQPWGYGYGYRPWGGWGYGYGYRNWGGSYW